MTHSLFSNILIACLILNATPHLADEKTSHFRTGHRRNRRSRSPPPPPNPKPLTFADERLAKVYPIIQKFKSTITSDPLNITTSWTGPNICNYTGFYCESPPDNASALAVASVDLNGFLLAAPTLDGFLDRLPDVALFHANSNRFGGTLSPSLAALRYLYELDLSNNKLSSSFPNAVLSLKGLSFLDIRFNLFTGSVPPQIFAQNNLNALFINNNDFVQITLPQNLPAPSHVLYLTLANNKLVGPIPPVVLKLFSDVTEVLLSNNELTGCVPYEVGFLKKAVVFDVAGNWLTGPLPVSLACMESVEQLNFAGNLLYGVVPEVVCELENLANFSLYGNYFVYVGPVCRRLIKRGVLDLGKNCVPDLPNQRSMEECGEFFASPKRSICPYFWSYYKNVPCEPPRFRSHAYFSPKSPDSPP